MKLKLEPRQLALFGVLGLLLLYLVYDNFLSGPSETPVAVKSGPRDDAAAPEWASEQSAAADAGEAWTDGDRLSPVAASAHR